MVSYIKWGTQVKGIRMQDPQADIWAQEGWELGGEDFIVEDFQRCYQKWEQRLHRWVGAQGDYFEARNIDVCKK